MWGGGAREPGLSCVCPHVVVGGDGYARCYVSHYPRRAGTGAGVVVSRVESAYTTCLQLGVLGVSCGGWRAWCRSEEWLATSGAWGRRGPVRECSCEQRREGGRVVIDAARSVLARATSSRSARVAMRGCTRLRRWWTPSVFVYRRAPRARVGHGSNASEPPRGRGCRTPTQATALLWCVVTGEALSKIYTEQRHTHTPCNDRFVNNLEEIEPPHISCRQPASIHTQLRSPPRACTLAGRIWLTSTPSPCSCAGYLDDSMAYRSAPSSRTRSQALVLS